MTEAAKTETSARTASRKQLHGVVVSNKGDKSITVQVERLTRHPRYHKTIRVRKKFYAHDEKNEASVGDRVIIVSTKPISKIKET